MLFLELQISGTNGFGGMQSNNRFDTCAFSYGLSESRKTGKSWFDTLRVKFTAKLNYNLQFATDIVTLWIDHRRRYSSTSGRQLCGRKSLCFRAWQLSIDNGLNVGAFSVLSQFAAYRIIWLPNDHQSSHTTIEGKIIFRLSAPNVADVN